MATDKTDFNLNPDPRILPMLGEINLAQWRCLAELIDNAVDGFLSASRSGQPTSNPEVLVNVPMTDQPGARIAVVDNGPGMSPEVLERAVSAGWSGNNPVDSLGMFGMGFNIATARLGTVTTVWTSRAGETEQCGLRIDFAELLRSRHFRTPRLFRPKGDPAASGTEVVIESLKPDQRIWFAKAPNRAAIREELSKAYSAMLREGGTPISFKLMYAGKRMPARTHCVWDDSRQTQTSRFGPVSAVQTIDRSLPDRPFCKACWQWLAASETQCPSCNSAASVILRKRHVHGWIGLQRFLSATSYGVDFIQNGRKIEIANRDLFTWKDPVTGTAEIEYPIDDPRQRGRVVGEIHLDHSRVTYMKDRFDRTDPAWDEMVGIVRGEGPLQPQKAASQGFGNNETPLFKLYQTFRRSSPKNRAAGGWRDVLVVKDNDRAEEMAKKYHEGLPEYQLDTKWWELVVEEDDKLLTGARPGSTPAAVGAPPGGLPGFGTAPTATPSASTTTGGATIASTPASSPRMPIPSLTREYRHDKTGLRYDVRAFSVSPDDPELAPTGAPWATKRSPDAVVHFVVNRAHDVFRSATMTELDALLCELAHRAADFNRQAANAPPYASILADLRDAYGASLKLDGAAILASAEGLFRSIARTWSIGIDAGTANQLFSEIPSADAETIQHRMAARSVANPQLVVAEARFLDYAPVRVAADFVTTHPEFFFDGKCWEDAYASLDFMHPAATEAARRAVVDKYEALLSDAVWLSEQDAADLDATSRERVLRASLAIDLLAPSPTQERSEET